MADIGKIEDLLKTVKTLSPMGFAVAFHLRQHAPDFLLQTYPLAWINTYSEKGYLLVDPTVHWCAANTGATRWSDLAELDTENVLKQAAEHGMNFGAIVSIQSSGSRSLAGFAHDTREFTDEEIEQLRGHVQDLHDLTASKTGMNADLRARLHELSIEMTHPTPA